MLVISSVLWITDSLGNIILRSEYIKEPVEEETEYVESLEKTHARSLDPLT